METNALNGSNSQFRCTHAHPIMALPSNISEKVKVKKYITTMAPANKGQLRNSAAWRNLIYWPPGVARWSIIFAVGFRNIRV